MRRAAKISQAIDGADRNAAAATAAAALAPIGDFFGIVLM